MAPGVPLSAFLVSRLLMVALLTVVKCQWNPTLLELYQLVPRINENLALDADDASHLEVSPRSGFRTTQIFQFLYDAPKYSLPNKSYHVMDIEYLEALQGRYDNKQGKFSTTRAKLRLGSAGQKWFIENVPDQLEYKRFRHHQYYQRCLTVGVDSHDAFLTSCEENDETQLWKIHPFSETVFSHPIPVLPYGYAESVEVAYSDDFTFNATTGLFYDHNSEVFKDDSMKFVYNACVEHFPQSMTD